MQDNLDVKRAVVSVVVQAYWGIVRNLLHLVPGQGACQSHYLRLPHNFCRNVDLQGQGHDIAGRYVEVSAP